jgi:NUAK family SNF1-like kinase
LKSIRILVYESREKIILVMEYASGGELYDYLNRMKRIPESQARAIFRQIVSAVHFLHKVNRPMNDFI